MGHSSKIRHRRRRRGEASGNRSSILALRRQRADEKREAEKIWNRVTQKVPS